MAQPTRDANVNIRMIREMATRDDYPQAVQEFYDKWADNYDGDFEGKYSSPMSCAEALGKVLTDKNALIVDCAAGTGRAGQELAKLGFKRIDAVDFSQKSLDISASKGVYERLICDSLGKNKLKGIEDGYYTGLICVGALSVGHVLQDVFPEWTRIVQKGGFMVFTLGKAAYSDDPQHQKDAVNEIEVAVNDLIQTGVWELVDKIDITYFCEHAADMYTIRRP